ncbi:SEC-C metal-binding domain-containing protein [Burkholderia cepacia]|uniref:SEC-C metal-binding domain-containing protein n=1 Tax=Burkholderia cepacia TaxID=292 RepID=UPI0038B6EC8D
MALMQIPAVCDRCGCVFSSGMAVDGTSAISTGSAGGKAGPCPKCNGQGTVLGGVYHGADDVLRIFLDRTVPADQVRRLKEILDGAARTGATAEATAQKIEAEVPAFAGINGWLTRNAPIINTIGALAGVVGAVVALLASNGPTEEELTRAFEHAIVRALQGAQQQPKNSSYRDSGFFQRIKASGVAPSQGAPCPCGSGKKYKRCCGEKRFQI